MCGHSLSDPRAVSRDTVLSGAFQENAARIYRFIYARVGNREDAEDLTSQVFLKAIRWLADGRDMISIRSWLYRTARSVLGDYWRAQGRLELVPLAEGVQPTAHDKDHRRAVAHPCAGLAHSRCPPGA